MPLTIDKALDLLQQYTLQLGQAEAQRRPFHWERDDDGFGEMSDLFVKPYR